MATKHIVPPLSDKEIEREASKWRNGICIINKNWADILFALETVIPDQYPEFRMEIVNQDELDGEEARTTFNPPRILISEQVYERAKNHEPRARFTLAHELGHLVLHRDSNEKTFARAPNVLMYVNHESKIRAYRSAERQADKFASCFLMPKDLLQDHHTIEDITQDFGVSEPAAKLRLAEVDKNRGKKISPHLQELIDQLRQNTGKK